MKAIADELTTKHPQLIHSENKKVISHTQRQEGDWFINTLMLTDCDVPFKYRRQKKYKSLVGQQVNVTYYPELEILAGFDMEVMRVIRLRRS